MAGKPYAISQTRVAKSPFSSVDSVKKALGKYKRKEKIGFTQLSSLRSMGLIKRADGAYKLGEKYT
ncbi:hypothetical protein ATCV1_Z232L [Acanthocystis turfacea chlorella virus 1]|uniref:Uncharacterized protein Z232L n=1 Tax=Chlorovirus heliozoae TaxID=322019 RepID=A7K8J2_9PHYC|nr:hypothetical protein ATCV1_Z232L [Acanthocystis turfacea chlorella virus 1]ABT16366.1 hypothetical protein ATCV1_Z232L [Acanthocystis turfacea chlorella virus 1]